MGLIETVFDDGCRRDPATGKWLRRAPGCPDNHPPWGSAPAPGDHGTCSFCGASLDASNTSILNEHAGKPGTIVHVNCPKRATSKVLDIGRRVTAGIPEIAEERTPVAMAKPVETPRPIDQTQVIATLPVAGDATPPPDETPAPTLYALSLSRPWPWVIFHLPPDKAKRVENRDKRLRELLAPPFVAIHAAESWDEDAIPFIQRVGGVKVPGKTQHPTGIIGVVHFTAIIDRMDLFALNEISRNPWFTGPWGHIFDGVRVLKEPVPHRGWPSVFKVTDKATRNVLKQLG